MVRLSIQVPIDALLPHIASGRMWYRRPSSSNAALRGGRPFLSWCRSLVLTAIGILLAGDGSTCQSAPKVSCVRSGQKSCLIEHSRLIILRNDSDSTFPRISLHYEYGGDSKLSVLQDVVLALDGSGSQLSRVSPMAASKATQLCESGRQVLQPVAIVMRNCSNLWHLLRMQLIPYFVALHDHGMDERSMQLLLLEIPACHPISQTVKDSFFPVFKALSASTPFTGKSLPQVICTTSILLPPTDYLTLAEHVEEPTAVSGKYVEGFVAWFRKILGVPPPMFSDQGQIQIMVLNRTENLISSNIGGLAEHFRTKLSHARIWSGDVSELTLSKQIRLVQKTSIFVAVHGDAHALMMFLPPQAVVVEIMPYRHHPGSPYHHGHRNFARMCNRSHVLWQNTQAAWSPDEAKLSDISLSDPTISKIADLSIDMLERNLKDWKQREVLA